LAGGSVDITTKEENLRSSPKRTVAKASMNDGDNYRWPHDTDQGNEKVREIRTTVDRERKNRRGQAKVNWGG